MKTSYKFSVLCGCLTAVIAANVHASFLGRLETAPGSGVFQAYYDDQLDITWTTDANINGLDTWSNHLIWAAGLTIDGVGDWRLASMDVNGDDVIEDCAVTSQAICADNEYGHLFTYGAGTTAGGGITTTSPSPFTNIGNFLYYSGTEGSDPSLTWSFIFDGGTQSQQGNGATIFAWAVHSGDVSAVPVPAAAWLFSSGLLGLVGVARRTNKHR